MRVLVCKSVVHKSVVYLFSEILNFYYDMKRQKSKEIEENTDICVKDHFLQELPEFLS